MKWVMICIKGGWEKKNYMIYMCWGNKLEVKSMSCEIIILI
jgi:hypothetical protein